MVAFMAVLDDRRVGGGGFYTNKKVWLSLSILDTVHS